jgi:RNA polymerase sigma factor (sigma-70 family)
LCRLAQAGDAQAEAVLLARYEPAVFRFTKPYFKYRNDLDDFRQEARIAVLFAIRRYDPERGMTFKSFACMRIKYALMAARARLESGGTCSNGAFYRDRPPPVGELTETREGSEPFDFEGFETRLEVEKLLNVLPEETRKIVELYYGLNGESPHNLRELGRLFNVSGQAANNWLSAARRVMREGAERENNNALIDALAGDSP